MEAFDREKALRVWQRVRGLPETPDLQALAEEALTDGAALLTLSRRFPDRRGQLLRQLSRQEQAHAGVLKGILAQTRGVAPRIRASAVKLERTESLLRRCREGMRHRLEIYTALSADPDWGKVYGTLAAQEQTQLLRLLELMGAIPPTNSPPRNRQPQRRRQWR